MLRVAVEIDDSFPQLVLSLVNGVDFREENEFMLVKDSVLRSGRG
jgi:hypothetical protein